MTKSVAKPLLGYFRPWMLLAATLSVGALGILAARRYHPNQIPSSPDQDRGARLHISPVSLHFGPVWESSSFQWVLPIENQGEKDVEIEELIASCGCTNVEPRSFVVPTHQSRDARLTIDLTQNRQSTAEPTDGRPFEVKIRPKLREEMASGRGDRWVLRGTVRPLLRLQPATVAVGDVSELNQTVVARTVRVSSVMPLKSLKITHNSPLLLSEVKRIPGDGERYELTVAVPPNPQFGQIEQDVILAAELDAGETVTRAVRVRGRVVKDCQSSPPEITLGAQLVGEMSEESLSLYSLTRRPLDVLETKVQGDGLSLDDMPVLRPSGVTVRVRQRILKPGAQVGKIVFSVRAGGGDMDEVIVPVSYHGLEP